MGLHELRRDLAFAAGVLRSRPFQVLIQVTNRCNMKCDFCDFWPHGATPQEELSPEEFRRLEEELAGLGRFLVSIEGGEPFVRSDLAEIVRIFRDRHMPMVYTNGWYVTEEKARELFDAGCVQFGVSIDYPDAARHDAKRRLDGAFDRARRALDILREAAPHGGRQVHVMTVLMEENWRDFEALLELSRSHGVEHCTTVLSVNGFRRGPRTVSEPPEAGVSDYLLGLWRRYPHFKVFREYLGAIDEFVGGGAALPTCRAGTQSFNIDHLGNVSPCIERIDMVAGNLREEPLAAIHSRMAELPEVRSCQDCWTVCRGFNQALGQGGTWAGWRDLSTRMRSA